MIVVIGHLTVAAQAERIEADALAAL